MTKILIFVLGLSSFSLHASKSNQKAKKSVSKTTKLRTSPIFKRSRSLASNVGIIIPFDSEVAKEAPKKQN